jgi:catechol 2,3-dioxygenase-like lactoylglutathione lyase family enzyme/GNAT superfamily N-acetyltransferase
MITLRGLDHLVLRVVDLDRMLRFYVGALGCSIERRQEAIGLVQLRAGASLIDLVPVDGPLGSAGGAAPGAEGRNLDHFCLRVEPFDEAGIRAQLADHGIDAGPTRARYGAEGEGPSIYLTDPEGNVVELKGPPTPTRRPASATDLRITTHDVLPADAAALVDAGLDIANAAAAPLGLVVPLACIAHAADGSVAGGAIGRSWGRCAELQQLWVDPAQRRRGIGAALVAAFERRASARGCRSVYLYTFSFQAPSFYRALGYVARLELRGFPDGIAKLTMVRELLPSLPEPSPTERGA